MAVENQRHLIKLGVLLVGLALVLSLPAISVAQSGVDGVAPALRPKPPAPADPGPDKTPAKIRVESSLVTTPVTVVDKSGEFVSDLDEKDFKLLDNGATQRIEQF